MPPPRRRAVPSHRDGAAVRRRAVCAAVGLAVALIVPGANIADAGARLTTARAVSAASGTTPTPGPRPIIFLAGITGSYLANGNSPSNEQWPQARGLFGCRGNGSPGQCESDLLKPNAFNPDGSSVNPSVRAASGVAGDWSPASPPDPYRKPLNPPIGGVVSSATVLYGWNHTVDAYDLTAQNASTSGYTVLQSADDVGLSACAATLKCFIPVGVDWRRSVAGNTGEILALIDRVLAVTGSDRVDLLAHSQGGLLAKAVVDDPRSVGKVYRIVTLGTPFLGAPKLLAELLYANVCQFPYSSFDGWGPEGCLIDPAVVQSLIENYPGAAELSPSRAYFSANPRSPLLTTKGGGAQDLTYDQMNQVIQARLASLPASQYGMPGAGPRDATLITQAEAFHDKSDRWAPADPTVGLLRMVGYDAAGVGGYYPGCAYTGNEYTAAGTVLTTDVDTQQTTPYCGSGDGTVPFYSASVLNTNSPIGVFDYRGGAHNVYWCGITHMKLAQSPSAVSSPDVWSWTKAYLEGSYKPTDDTAANLCPDSTFGSLPSLLPAALSLEPNSVDFGKVIAGSSPSSMPVLIRNLGLGDLTVSSLTLGGDGSYVLTPVPSSSGGCGTTPLVLGPFSSCRLSISFAPYSTGTKAATLTAQDAKGSHVLPITGIGYWPTTVQAYDFGSVAAGESVYSYLALTAGSDGPHHVSSVSISGPGAAAYSILSDPCSGTTLSASQTCWVTVSFHPTAPASYPASLDIAVDGGPLSGPLSGQGVAPSGQGVAAHNTLPGYWLVARDGGIFPFGSAGGYGSTGGIHLNSPITGMARTPDGGGYWLVASDGGIFPFGNAGGYGSTGGMRLNSPIVGMAATPDGLGYWLLASDGGIFPFGDARGFGSTGGAHLNSPIVGMSATPDGGGYWLVASDGGIFPFGDAGGYGSTGGSHLNQAIVGMTATPTGHGYWLVASDGGIFPFGDSAGYGSTGGIHLNQPILAMAVTADGRGYWLVASDGGIFPFGDAAGLGSTGGTHLNQPIVGLSARG